jgi:hypothetical protein
MQRKHVLVVGLGKFGTVKAEIYSRLGCVVDALDTNPQNNKKLEGVVSSFYNTKDEIRLSYDIYEICVPTSFHSEYIKKLTINDPNVTIVCEKPLCSNFRDLATALEIQGRNNGTNYVYSENYAASHLTIKAIDLIKEFKLIPTHAVIEFSKDRRDDISVGRFVDPDLEGFGIEVPHMLTTLEMIGIGFDQITTAETDDLFCNDSTYLRQGNIKVKGTSQNGTVLEMYQSLDGFCNFHHEKFSFDPSYKSPYRILYIEFENNYKMFIQYEPIYHRERFVGKVELIHEGNTIFSEDIPDMPVNQLIEMIVKNTYENNKYAKYLSFTHGAEIAGTLIGLQKHSIMKNE